jgi:hypothetical protein
LKELQGSASAEVAVAVEGCFALIASIDRYPAWFEVVRHAEVLEWERRSGPPAI